MAEAQVLERAGNLGPRTSLDANLLSPPILSLSLLILKWGNNLSQAVDS